MSRFMKLAALLILAALTGCADRAPAWFGRTGLSPSGDYYLRSDLDELLRFGADMARKSSSARAEECRWLTKHRPGPTGPGLRLHLLSARLLSDACGDRGRIIDGVQSIPRGSLDPEVQWLAAAQIEALRRSGGGGCPPCVAAASGGRRGTEKADRKSKSTPAPAAVAPADESAPTPAPASGKKDEAKILREKLEAIRSMERKLDKATGDQ